MKLNPKILSLSVLGVMYSVNAVADNTPSTTLQTITIVAQNTKNQNQTDDIYHENQVSAKQADSLHDYLGQVAGVQVRGSSSFDQHIAIRGIGNDNDGSLLKITVDGVRQPETTGFHHMGSYGLDPDLYKATEVSVGNNSVTLGNNAIGGAVAFRTVDAEDLLRPDQTIGARLKLGYASNDSQVHSTATVYGKPTDNSDVLLSYGQRESDGGKDGRGKHIIGDDISIKNILAKVSVKPVEGHKLSLSYQQTDNDGNYPFRPNIGYQANLPNNVQPGYLNNKTYSIGYDYTPNDDFELTSKLYKLENESKVQGFFGDKLIQTGGFGETTGLNLNVNQNLSQALSSQNLNHRLTYGLEAYKKQSESLTGSTSTEATSAGVYLQDRINFGKLTVTPGIRYDNYKATNTKDQSETFDKVSGALGLEYQILPKTSVFASYTQLFNGPRLPETLRNSSYLYDLSKLKPETGNNTEVGFSTRFDDVFKANDSLGLTAKYFNTDYKNKFVRETTSGYAYREDGTPVAIQYQKDADGNKKELPFPFTTYSGKYINAGDVEYKGYEVMANYRKDNIGVNLGYAHAKSKDADGYQLSRDSGDQLTLGFNYGNVDDYLIGVNFRHVASLDRKGAPSRNNQTGITRLDSFTTVDLTGSYKPKRLPNVSIDAGIYNLTDEYYAEHTSNYLNDTAMGRNAKIAVTYQF